MYFANYIPTNMNCTNCVVYSKTKHFPEKRLLDAYNMLLGKNTGTAHISESGAIAFVDDNSFEWTVPEVYLAHEAYTVAKDKSFSFFTVMDEADIPQLFISKEFKGHRIIVDAMTLKAQLLNNKLLVAKAAALIGRKLPRDLAHAYMNGMCNVEDQKGKYLSALIVDRGTNDEALIMSPLFTPSLDDTYAYGTDAVQEIASILPNQEAESESYKWEEHAIVRKDIPGVYKPISKALAQYIVEKYNKCIESKSNYISIMDKECNVIYYYSTNNRYLVDAVTLEQATITSPHIRNMINDIITRKPIDVKAMQWAWTLAREDMGLR